MLSSEVETTDAERMKKRWRCWKGTRQVAAPNCKDVMPGHDAKFSIRISLCPGVYIRLLGSKKYIARGKQTCSVKLG